MAAILQIPEVAALNAAKNLVRIPNQIDVPLTPRIRKIVDTREFQRLSHISQLGLVAFVYPGATHTRFEHSLGVYRNALLVLRQLGGNVRFAETVDEEQATALILAALLHDIGHWPYCHPMEGIGIEGLPEHEAIATEAIENGAIGALIREDFGLEPAQVTKLIERNGVSTAERLLGSILSGPIDVDKLDYLYRDSLHAGVPYGQNFDSGRLVGSLCLNETGDKLAITHKGRTAAELMVFARYVMFSEVYWHHAVRSATAMLQRATFLSVHEAEDWQAFVHMDDLAFHYEWPKRVNEDSAQQLLDSLFGSKRQLYKRAANYSFLDNESVYRALAQQPYASLVEKSRRLGQALGETLGQTVGPDDVLIDAPPVGLEVQFNVDVYYPKSDSYRTLGEVSPVVSTLARQQFDDFVKQVRIFVKPELKPALADLPFDKLVNQVVFEDNV